MAQDRVRNPWRLLLVCSGQLYVGHREVELADGERIALAAREFELLWVPASRPDTVYSRTELRRMVFHEAPASSIVDTYVYYLRRKPGRQVVRTVRGLGYRLGRCERDGVLGMGGGAPGTLADLRDHRVPSSPCWSRSSAASPRQ